MTIQKDSINRITVRADLPAEDVHMPDQEEIIHDPEGDAQESSEHEGDGDIHNDPEPSLIEPKDNPYESSLNRGKPRKLIKRLKRAVANLVYKAPTPEEMANKSEIQRRKLEHKLLEKEAAHYEKIFHEEFELHGLNGEKKKGMFRKKLRFKHPIRGNLQALYFRVDMKHRPGRVTIQKLMDPELLQDLQVRMNVPVSFKTGIDIGSVYRIDRSGSYSGIPAHVSFQEMWDRVPASADGLAVGFGMTTNTRPIFWSLADMPHLLIAGASNHGKSNFIKYLLTMMIRRNSPKRLQFVLVDVKRLDLHVLSGCPHIKEFEGLTDARTKGIVKDKAAVKPVLEWCVNEMNRRFHVLDEDNDESTPPSNIAEYNSRHRANPLSRIVIVIDELASVMDCDDGPGIMGMIIRIAELGRAAGMHLILATQTPSSKIIDTRIKNNIPARLALNCGDLQGSMAILNNGLAQNLPVGRAYLKYHGTVELQTPLITPEVIQATIQGAQSGKFDQIQAKHDVTPEEVMAYAIREKKGHLTLKGSESLYNQFRDRGIAREELASWLSDWEGKEYVVGDSTYKVLPNSGGLPRRLVAVEPGEENGSNPEK